MPDPLAHTTCRLCGGPLDAILDLGILALPVFPAPSDPLPPSAPLHLLICRTCTLVQLAHTVPPDALYRQYWYRSGINETMRAELMDVVQQALLTVSLFSDDLVLDVGANDGFLLSQYPQQRAFWHSRRIAYEPARNLQAACQAHAEVLVPDYFVGPQSVSGREWQGRVKILTTVAMFYDLEDPAACVRAVDQLLHQDGVWVVQLQDLAQMVEATAFDNLCHEHLTYWSLETFEALLEVVDPDLHVTHVERRAINGGSLRILVRRRIYAQDATVEALRQTERAHVDWLALERFAWRVGQVAAQIRGVVMQAHDRGDTVDLYGASTKANTLLQVCALGGSLLRQAWERNLEKIGRATATGIPIVTEGEGRRDPPQLLLAGIWQFRMGILDREKDYLASGGRILFPLPDVDLVQDAAAHV